MEETSARSSATATRTQRTRQRSKALKSAAPWDSDEPRRRPTSVGIGAAHGAPAASAAEPPWSLLREVPRRCLRSDTRERASSWTWFDCPPPPPLLRQRRRWAILTRQRGGFGRRTRRVFGDVGVRFGGSEPHRIGIPSSHPVASLRFGPRLFRARVRFSSEIRCLSRSRRNPPGRPGSTACPSGRGNRFPNWFHGCTPSASAECRSAVHRLRSAPTTGQDGNDRKATARSDACPAADEGNSSEGAKRTAGIPAIGGRLRATPQGSVKTKRGEPSAGCRVQQTCNSSAEKAVEVVRNHEGGTRSAPGGAGPTGASAPRSGRAGGTSAAGRRIPREEEPTQGGSSVSTSALKER
jgi:hypothetical protein